MTASNQPSYTTDFALSTAIEAQTLLVRVRSVDVDGKYSYSQPVTVAGMCDNVQPWVLNVYPNPATNVRSVVISSTVGEFKGKYRVSMMDISGQTIQVKEIQLDRTSNFKYDFGTISGGQYLIQVVNMDGSQSGVLKLEKL